LSEAVAADEETAACVVKPSRAEDVEEERAADARGQLTRFLREREQGDGDGTPPPTAQ
jgi:hypothetical protein